MNINVFISNIALALREGRTYTPFSADAWSYVGQMTLLGMGMIFAVLAILWAVLALFKVFFAKGSTSAKKEEAVQSKKTPVTVPVPKVAVAPKNNDAQLVAVLTAAVAAYMSEEQGGAYVPDGSFRVVSFKRVRNGRAWNSK